MANWADGCEAIWLDASLAAALVSGLAALAMIQCRQPARRRIWGRFGLIGSLLVIPLVAVVPLPKLDLRHPTRSIWIADPRPRASAGLPATTRATATRPATARSDPPHKGSAGTDQTWATSLRRWLLILYGCGLALGLGRLGLGLAGTWYLVRSATSPSPRAAALLDSLPSGLVRKRRPRLLISGRMGRPVLVGGSQAAILIPPDLDHPAAEPQLRLGLLHELAHAELADAQFGLVAELAYAVWFPFPQVWWIQSQLRLDAEFLADHRAVGHFGTSYRYAESLVGLALPPVLGDSTRGEARGGRPSPASWPPRTGGLASALFQRVQMLLKCPFRVEDRAPRSWTLGVGLISLGAVVLASCLSIRDRDESMTVSLGPLIDGASRVFHLEELAIAPQLVDDRPFDLRFRLPERFRLACEILAEPVELGQIEILGYHLGSADRPPVSVGAGDRPAWRRVEIVRGTDGLESAHVDGVQVVATHRPTKPAAWLTIRPAPGRTTRLRDLHLTY